MISTAYPPFDACQRPLGKSNECEKNLFHPSWVKQVFGFAGIGKGIQPPGEDYSFRAVVIPRNVAG